MLTEESSSKPPEWPRVYLFGDSLTDWAFMESDGGFGDRLAVRSVSVCDLAGVDYSQQVRFGCPRPLTHLQKYYDERAEILNRGVAGATTRTLQSYFRRYIIEDAHNHTKVPPLLVTIFLGANDACFAPAISGSKRTNLVPLPEFLSYIRGFVEHILRDPVFTSTKVLLITPPPIDVSSPLPNPWLDEVSEQSNEQAISQAKKGLGYRTWSEKRKYAEAIVALSEEFKMKDESEGRVGLLDAWKELTKAKIGRGEEGFLELDRDEKLPGCGLPGAMEFGRDWFRDGLHFGKEGYQILGDSLMENLLRTWPALKRENLDVLDEL